MKVCIHCCIEFEEDEGGEYYCSEKCKRFVRKKFDGTTKELKNTTQEESVLQIGFPF